MVNELTAFEMAAGMGCFVAAFIAILIGILLIVKGSLDRKKTSWIPAVAVLVIGIICIATGFNFVRI